MGSIVDSLTDKQEVAVWIGPQNITHMLHIAVTITTGDIHHDIDRTSSKEGVGIASTVAMVTH